MEAVDSQANKEGKTDSEQNFRRKTDIAWKYVTEKVNPNGRKIMICDFCECTLSGGGINRMKQHLGGVKGNVAPCKKVTAEVRLLMSSSLKEIADKAKAKKGDFEINMDGHLGDDALGITNEGTNKRKKNDSHGIEPYLSGKSFDPSQPSIKSCMQSKEKCLQTDMAIALWFYDACIPFNAVNSPYFEQAISRIASMGHGYTGPSYHALRVNLLRDARKQVELLVDSFRSRWAETGCTIMGDGWKDGRQRSLINFLVYCPSGIAFIKSVDASDIESNAENLCNLFSDIVEIVGVENVVHLVTDNASNYKAAGKLLSTKYPSISWSPCAAHCLNLVMKDIGEIPKINTAIILASRVTKFVYNRKWILSWLRKRPGWREILRPAETRFGTTFIALKSLYDHKEHLVALVTSMEFKKELKNVKGKDVRQIVFNDEFWNTCLISVKIMGPVIRLLRICDSDKPSLGYVYDGMGRIVDGIKELFLNKKRSYKPYIDIIEKRWDNMLKKDLHAAAFWLNPAFQYDNRCNMLDIWMSVLEVMGRSKIEGMQHVMDEITQFRTRSNMFGIDFAVNTCKTSRPDEWWRMFGGNAPNLQKLAIRLLSQTASSSGCERNWSVFDRIHTKRRNRLEHKRLSDLVYVHYNLRLKNRLTDIKKAYDPIDYESVDKTDFWIIEEQPEAELDIDELEDMIEEEYPRDGEEGSSQPSKNNSDMVNIEEDDDDIQIDLSCFEKGDDLEGDGDGDGYNDDGLDF